MAYPARARGLEIRRRQEGACTVVEVAGELDMNAVPLLRAELDGVMRATRRPCLVLDLTKTTFCDSAGLGLLVGTYTRVRETGGRVVFAVVPGMISRLLTITHLDHHFETYESADDAVEILRAA